MNHPRLSSALAGAALWGLLAPGAPALESDSDQPINIEADSAVMDDSEGVAVYEGRVVVTQGSIRILGDKVKVHLNDANGFDRAYITGGPARFRQLPEDKEEYIKAEARTIEYLAEENLLHLIEAARITQGGDLFSGERIDYDTARHRVKARGSTATADAGDGEGDGERRVRITFQPKKNGEGGGD